jgi:phosphatidylglycerol lysyltransferase
LSTREGIDETDEAGTSSVTNALVWLRRGVPIVLLSCVALLLYRARDEFSFEALRATTQSIPFISLVGLVAIGIAAVATMYLYDWALARWQGIDIPQARLFHYSWVANGISNIAGMSGLTGSGIRFMLLTRAGVPADRAAVYAGVQVLCIPLGLAVLTALALAVRGEMPVSVALPHWLALVVLAGVTGYLLVFLLLTGDTALHRRYPKIPSLPWRVRLELVGASFIEWLAAAATFAACVAATGTQVKAAAVVSAFSLAAAVSLVSFIPGGLGVFDAAVVLLLADGGEHEAMLTAVALYRVVYFLIPLIVALRAGAGLLSVDDDTLLSRLADRVAAHPLLGVLRLPIELLSSLVTRLLSYLTFACGLVLLLSAAFPTIAERTEVLRSFVPLLAIESSHLLSTAAGVVLIAVARGIAARVRSAYTIAQVMLVGGAALSLLKGIDYEEALLLLAVSLLLWGSRGRFTRKGYALRSPRTQVWVVATALAIAAYIFVGRMLYGEIAIAGHLFSFRDTLDEARFARGVLMILVALLCYLGWSWFHMPGPRLALPGREALAEAKRFYDTNGGTAFSHLTFTGDKYLYYSSDGAALIQYAVVRNRMVTLGDPAGSGLVRAVREFREYAYQYNRVPVFYQVDEEHVHHYHDTGFALLKLGERAFVSLPDLSLRGKAGAELRTALNRGVRLGLEVDLVEPPYDDVLWSELAHISRVWLDDKHHAEKGFSLGRFERGYLGSAPIAVVRHSGRIVAFASLMPGYGQRRELSIDLMRHLPDAPNGTMDFLFVELMQYAKERDYRYFDLGMAPLSGVGETSWSRRDERLLRLVYELGTSWYNYKGLRRYKEKFNPQWRSLYLAWPHDLAVHPILIDLAVLVAGGYRRLLSHALVTGREPQPLPPQGQAA